MKWHTATMNFRRIPILFVCSACLLIVLWCSSPPPPKDFVSKARIPLDVLAHELPLVGTGPQETFTALGYSAKVIDRILPSPGSLLPKDRKPLFVLALCGHLRTFVANIQNILAFVQSAAPDGNYLVAVIAWPTVMHHGSRSWWQPPSHNTSEEEKKWMNVTESLALARGAFGGRLASEVVERPPIEGGSAQVVLWHRIAPLVARAARVMGDSMRDTDIVIKSRPDIIYPHSVNATALAAHFARVPEGSFAVSHLYGMPDGFYDPSEVAWVMSWRGTAALAAGWAVEHAMSANASARTIRRAAAAATGVLDPDQWAADLCRQWDNGAAEGVQRDGGAADGAVRSGRWCPLAPSMDRYDRLILDTPSLAASVCGLDPPPMRPLSYVHEQFWLLFHRPDGDTLTALPYSVPVSVREGRAALLRPPGARLPVVDITARAYCVTARCLNGPETCCAQTWASGDLAACQRLGFTWNATQAPKATPTDDTTFTWWGSGFVYEASAVRAIREKNSLLSTCVHTDPPVSLPTPVCVSPPAG
eukprot:TRINITY_DN699_c0_g1_i9.p1 TRINITY_DN699_c0_g1~~TRINITY_DN699_c0_g1_i9.p1  ORF type:complete len:533 (+),score=92.66 TRINITY_DN699_c0_g1_i9:91-1689(+)